MESQNTTTHSPFKPFIILRNYRTTRNSQAPSTHPEPKQSSLPKGHTQNRNIVIISHNAPPLTNNPQKHPQSPADEPRTPVKTPKKRKLATQAQQTTGVKKVVPRNPSTNGKKRSSGLQPVAEEQKRQQQQAENKFAIESNNVKNQRPVSTELHLIPTELPRDFSLNQTEGDLEKGIPVHWDFDDDTL